LRLSSVAPAVAHALQHVQLRGVERADDVGVADLEEHLIDARQRRVGRPATATPAIAASFSCQ
jgi:hypothetical protein